MADALQRGHQGPPHGRSEFLLLPSGLRVSGEVSLHKPAARHPDSPVEGREKGRTAGYVVTKILFDVKYFPR